MNNAEVLIKFKADTSDVDKQTKTLTQKLQGSFSNAAKIMAPYSAAATGLIAGITKTGIDFEKSMSNVQAISGATSEDMGKLEQKAREMGKATIYSASESADALSYMALAGWKTDDMLEGLPGILNLAAAGNTDLAITSDIVTDSLTAFGMSAQDSTKLADVMAAAMSNSNTTIELLGESFKYAAPVAGALGYSMQDTTLALGLMANAGIKGSQAGTSLRQVMSRLSTDTSGARTALEELGVKVMNADGTMRPLNDVIRDGQKAFKGLSAEEQAATAKIIAGQTGMSGFLAMMNATTEDTDKLSNAIYNSSGAAQNMADVMNKSTANQMKILMSEVQELALQFAEVMLPVVKKVVGFLTKLAQKFQKLSPTIKKVLSVVLGVVAVASPVLLFIAKILPAIKVMVTLFKGLITVVKLVGTAFKLFGAILAANPIVLIVAGIVALIAGLVLLYNKCEWFRDFVNGWIEGFKIMIDGIVGFIKGAIDTVIGFITGIIDFFKNNWQTILSFIINPFGTAFKLLYDKCEWFRNIVNTVINNVKGFFTGLWTSMKNGAIGAWNSVKSVFSTVTSFFRNIFTNAWNAVKNVFSTGGKIFTGIKEGILNGFKTIVNGIIGGINKVVKIPFDGIKTALNKIRNVSIAGQKPFKGLIPSIKVPQIPKLNVGTNEVPEDMLAMIHKGEAVVPKKFNPYANGMSNSTLGAMNNSRGKQVINVYASFKQDNLGQVVRDIKTFSGGARNDFNYGM